MVAEREDWRVSALTVILAIIYGYYRYSTARSGGLAKKMKIHEKTSSLAAAAAGWLVSLSSNNEDEKWLVCIFFFFLGLFWSSFFIVGPWTGFWAHVKLNISQQILFAIKQIPYTLHSSAQSTILSSKFSVEDFFFFLIKKRILLRV